MHIHDNLVGYIIHTKKLDRSTELRRQLDSLGIRYEMVESLSYWSDKQLLEDLHRGSEVYEYTIGRNISLAEIGGSYGHQLAYQRMVSDGTPWGMIFEDDALLLRHDLPLDKLIKMTSPAHINLAEHRRAIYSLREKKNGLQELIMPSTWAHAYLINLEAARKYSNNFMKYGITSYPDWPYPQPLGIRFFITDVEYFGQIDPGTNPTMTSERLKIPMSNNHYSLVMPISFLQLGKRVYRLLGMGFHVRDVLHQEIVLRCRTRLSLGMRKANRIARKLSVS